MEDMKGKIRVYCRSRPMLPFELEKGQKCECLLCTPAVSAVYPQRACAMPAAAMLALVSGLEPARGLAAVQRR